MEGSESEEVKSVKRGSPECLQVKRKRVDKKKKKKEHGASRLRKGTDVSQGQGDMAGGSDRHQVKRKRVEEEESFSWLQRCTDASSKGEIAGGSEGSPECLQVKRKRVDKKKKKKKKLGLSWLVEHQKQLALEHAEMALQFYEESQDDAEYEILEVLNRSYLRLQHPESVSRHLWSHISFIAKPRKADCNVSPKHFFGESFRDDNSWKIHVTYCSTFQPSDDPGFNHGCIFCPRGLKYHPSDGYCVGRPPWHKQRVVYGHPSSLREGTDVSQGVVAGGSDRQQVKRKRVEEESFSWLQRCTDASSKGEIVGGSEHRQVKRRRVKHKRLNENDGGLSW